MGRLGTFVVVSALTAPLGGTVTADAPGMFLLLSNAQAHPAFFDLNGWYAGAGDAWSRASAAPATFGRAAWTARGFGSGFGNGVATHWPRGGNLGAWSGVLSATDGSRRSSGWPAAVGGLGHVLARGFMRDAVYRARVPGGAEVARAAFGRTTIRNLAARRVRFGMRWSSENEPLAK